MTNPFHDRPRRLPAIPHPLLPAGYPTSSERLLDAPGVLYIATSVRRSLTQAQEFNVKNQRGIRRYGPSRALSAIRHFGRNDYCPLPTDFHAGNTAVPTFDYTPRPQQK